MGELASVAILAHVWRCMVRLAQSDLVPGGYMSFLMQLIDTVRECTLITKLASFSSLPVLTEFCLFFLLVSRLELLFCDLPSRRSWLLCKGKLLSRFTFKRLESGMCQEVMRLELGSEVIEVLTSLRFNRVRVVVWRELIHPGGRGRGLC